MGVGWLSIHILDKAAHSFNATQHLNYRQRHVDARTAAGDGLTLHTSSVMMARENLVPQRIWLEGPAGSTLQLRVSTNVRTAWVPAQLTPWSQRSHPERPDPLPSW